MSSSNPVRLWGARAPRSSIRALLVGLLVVAGLLQGVGALGQDAPADTEVAAMEAETARLEEMSRGIREALDIFIIHDDKREPLEGVLVKGRSAEVWFLRPLDRNIEDAKCDAFRWLLLGRLTTSKGALEIFKKYPELEQLTLVFYSVETRVRSDRRGGYIQDRTPVRHLELTLNRDRAQALDPKRVPSALRGGRDTCIESGQTMVDRYWYIK